MNTGPLNPELMKAWNKGRESGRKEATEMFYEFIKERMEALEEIGGIGSKTAFKVQMHFLSEMEKDAKGK